MINLLKAKNIIYNTFPDKRIELSLDYDDNAFLFSVVSKNNNEPDYNSPWWLVRKDTGEVLSFTPFEDLDKFYYAIDHKVIK